MSGIMIAGTKSGVGKTTIAMGLMAALSKKMTVQPYKVGPDYIDGAFHSYITGRQCRNLDSYILSHEMIGYFYHKNLKDVDVAIVEGVMGLFDGAEVGSDVGTSASVAKILGLPVLLVVDGSKVATSLAATVKGFDLFDPDLRISGVIINNVGSKDHYELLKRGIEYHTDVKPCGYLIKNSMIALPERHLGLTPAGEQSALDDVFVQLAEQVEATVDIEAILTLAKKSGPRKEVVDVPNIIKTAVPKESVRIGIAKDKAFNFYYQDALDLLEDRYNVEWVSFSPLKDKCLPDNLHGLYIGGGFPEMFASELSKNQSFMTSMYDSLKSGIPYVAECGGLMYLCNQLVDLDENRHDMVAWLDGVTTMKSRLQHFGYAKLSLLEDCVYGKAGSTIRIHEFHRSVADVEAKVVYKLEKTRYGQVTKSWQCGYMKGNGIASYAHIHFGSNEAYGEAFVEACRDYKEKKQ